MKNKIVTAIGAMSMICFLGGCGMRAGLPDDPAVYEWGINKEEGHSYMEYGDKIYVPYCPYEARLLGDCIGYCDIPADEYVDASRVYIFELEGYSPGEWIVEMMELNNCREGMIFREVNAQEIPEGLVSVYEWNN